MNPLLAFMPNFVIEKITKFSDFLANSLRSGQNLLNIQIGLAVQ